MNEVLAAAALSAWPDARQGRGRTELEAALILRGTRRGPVTTASPTRQRPLPLAVRIEAGRPRADRPADLLGV